MQAKYCTNIVISQISVQCQLKKSIIFFSFSVSFFGSGRLLKAEIDWYRGPYNSSSISSGETPGDLTESRVSAMAALLEIQPDHQLNTAIVLLGRSCL
jgi:hypothetical protein